LDNGDVPFCTVLWILKRNQRIVLFLLLFHAFDDVSHKRHLFFISTPLTNITIFTIARIKEHNAKEGATFTLGHNEFSAMTEQEFAAHMNLRPVVEDDATVKIPCKTNCRRRRRLRPKNAAAV
jgi:hypothetical protein